MMQGIHCPSDAPFVVARLGEKRAREGAYAWRRVLDAGARIGNGTDAPVEDVDPIASLHASVTRQPKKRPGLLPGAADDADGGAPLLHRRERVRRRSRKTSRER